MIENYLNQITEGPDRQRHASLPDEVTTLGSLSVWIW